MTPRQPGQSEPRPDNNRQQRTSEEQRRHIEELKSQDPAADVVDIARDWRRSFYAAGYDANYIAEKSFVEEGFDGGHALRWMIDNLRDEKRGPNDLLPYEKTFLKHMEYETRANFVQRRVDHEALQADYGDLEGDEAMLARAEEVRNTLKQKLDDSAIDSRTKAKLQRDVAALDFFLANEGEMPADDEPCAAEYFHAAHEFAQNNGDSDKETAYRAASQKLRTYDKHMNLMYQAWRAIADNGYTLPREKQADMRQLRPDRELHYKAVDGYIASVNEENSRPEQNPNPAPENPDSENDTPDQDPENENLQTQPEQDEEGDDIPAWVREVLNRQERQINQLTLAVQALLNSQNPRNGRNAEASTESQQPQETPEQKAVREAKERELSEIDNRLKAVNERLDGSADIEGVRKQLARMESQIVRNSKIGRAVCRIFGVKVRSDLLEVKAHYAELNTQRFGLELRKKELEGSLDGLSDDQLYDAELHDLEREAERLRGETNKHVRNTLVAKFCRAIGKFEARSGKSWLKYGAILGGGALLAPLTFGASFGLAAGTLAAAKNDMAWRGLPEATKRTSSAQMKLRIDKMMNDRDAMRKGVKEILGKDIDPDTMSDSEKKHLRYQLGTAMSLWRYERDIDWEKYKRVGALGVGAIAGTVATIGINTVPQMGTDWLSNNFYWDSKGNALYWTGGR